MVETVSYRWFHGFNRRTVVFDDREPYNGSIFRKRSEIQ